MVSQALPAVASVGQAWVVCSAQRLRHSESGTSISSRRCRTGTLRRLRSYSSASVHVGHQAVMSMVFPKTSTSVASSSPWSQVRRGLTLPWSMRVYTNDGTTDGTVVAAGCS